MRPYVERAELVPAEDIYLLGKIRSVYNQMGDLGQPDTVSCHTLTEAFYIAFGEATGMAVEHGDYAKGYNHSWLRTDNGHIIDIYPVAVVGGPILVEGRIMTSPGKRLYKEDGSREAYLRGKEDQVKRLVELIREAAWRFHWGSDYVGEENQAVSPIGI